MILIKSKIYESRILKEEFVDENYREIFFHKRSWSPGLMIAAERGSEKMICFFVNKYEDYLTNFWDETLSHAITGKHPKIIDYCIYRGAKDWEYGLDTACKNNQTCLMNFFLSKLFGSLAFDFYALFNTHFNEKLGKFMLKVLEKNRANLNLTKK